MAVLDLGELDEHAVHRARVDEGDLAGQPVARLLVDQLEAERPDARQLGADVVRAQADVVQRGAAALEEARHPGVFADRLEQLDLVLADRKQHAAHALLLDDLVLRDAQAHDVAVEAQRLVGVGYDESHVVQQVDQRPCSRRQARIASMCSWSCSAESARRCGVRPSA